MTHNKRLLSWLLGATALAALTYTATRRSSQRRAADDSALPGASGRSGPTLSADASRVELESAELASFQVPAWEELGNRPSTPDALDVALDLEGVFDASDELAGLTVRSAKRVPLALSGDDQEPPAPEDLGSAWLLNATQSELGVSEADLAADLDNILPSIDDSLAALDEQDFEADDDGSFPDMGRA